MLINWTKQTESPATSHHGNLLAVTVLQSKFPLQAGDVVTPLRAPGEGQARAVIDGEVGKLLARPCVHKHRRNICVDALASDGTKSFTNPPLGVGVRLGHEWRVNVGRAQQAPNRDADRQRRWELKGLNLEVRTEAYNVDPRSVLWQTMVKGVEALPQHCVALVLQVGDKHVKGGTVAPQQPPDVLDHNNLGLLHANVV